MVVLGAQRNIQLFIWSVRYCHENLCRGSNFIISWSACFEKTNTNIGYNCSSILILQAHSAQQQSTLFIIVRLIIYQVQKFLCDKLSETVSCVLMVSHLSPLIQSNSCGTGEVRYPGTQIRLTDSQDMTSDDEISVKPQTNT